jgi:hypothetical protein
MAYVWQEMPEYAETITPNYIFTALGIYVITYALHLLGWHALAKQYIGIGDFQANAEAVATSDLVKYLPTIGWYIANRVHYYQMRNVSKSAVIMTSLLEVAAMLLSGSLLYLVFWSASGDFRIGLLFLMSLGILFGLLIWPNFRHQWQAYNVEKLLKQRAHHAYVWFLAFIWYGSSWVGGGIFLAAVLRIFVIVEPGDLFNLLGIWLVAGLSGYIISLSLGTINIAREATLVVLLAQHWPLSAGISTALIVKIILTVGQIVCALIVLFMLYMIRITYMRRT